MDRYAIIKNKIYGEITSADAVEQRRRRLIELEMKDILTTEEKEELKTIRFQIENKILIYPHEPPQPINYRIPTGPGGMKPCIWL